MFGRRRKSYSMTYEQAVKYLETAYIPSSMLLDSLGDFGPISMKSIDRKVLEAQEIVHNHNVEEILKYK